MTQIATPAIADLRSEATAAAQSPASPSEHEEALKRAAEAGAMALTAASSAGAAVLKVAALSGTATLRTGAVAFKTASVEGARLFDHISGHGKCPKCGSIDIVRTDASGLFQDAYKCRKCEQEYTTIGRAAALRLVRGALGLGLLATTGLHVGL
jgi:predicted RNA-binding Zn-ribbon protein involved in translation (DUF1610 family)